MWSREISADVHDDLPLSSWQDPEAVTEALLENVLSGAKIARSDDHTSLLAARIGHELLQAAQAHLNQLIASSDEEHADAPRSKLQVRRLSCDQPSVVLVLTRAGHASHSDTIPFSTPARASGASEA